MEESQRQEIYLHIENAEEMLEAAQVMLNNDFYTSVVNRAYYSVFYAANAMLLTKGLSRKKHSGVISLFRKEFVKTNLLPIEYSEIYGRIMSNRQASDYELASPITPEVAQESLDDAKSLLPKSSSI